MDRAAWTVKGCHDAVTGQLDYAALMFRDGGIYQLGAMTLEARERSDLVGTHQPAVANNISSQDRGQTSFHAGRHPTARDLPIIYRQAWPAPRAGRREKVNTYSCCNCEFALAKMIVQCDKKLPFEGILS